MSSATSEKPWQESRLIPTTGIGGADEQERRATSALLAVMSVVKEFSRALLGPLGAPVGPTATYIEVGFPLGDKKVIPDGVVRVTRGSKTWTALVEVKTGKNDLLATQLENYLDVAREQGFDCLITISNEIPPAAGQHPTAVDKRKLRKVSLHHWSWAYLLAIAVMQKEHKGVTDPEQAWILGELIRYLESPRSGALEFDDMGPGWVTIRQAVSAGTLRAGDKDLPAVIAKWDALLRFTALGLGRQLGTDVTHVLSRREQSDQALRAQTLTSSIVTTGELSGSIRIPNTIAPINIRADLRSGRLTCWVDMDAPKEGRSTTRVNWLLKQLKNAPDGLRIEAFIAGTRTAGHTEILSKIREDPSCIIAEPKRDLRAFRIEISTPMGSKRGRGRGAFIDSVVDVVNEFYSQVVQHLKAWSAAPPKMRPTPEPPSSIPPPLASTALSSQDGPERVDTDSDETGPRRFEIVEMP